MADFQLNLEFVHVTEANAAERNLFLEVSCVFWRCDERCHFLAESFDICKRGINGDEDIDAFTEAFTTGDVVDPKRVKRDIRNLVYIS